MGKPSYAERITRKKNQLRSDIRQKSRVTENVLRSMQTCSIKDNLEILNDQISKLCKDEVKRNINLSLINHLKGLRAILQMLIVQIPSQQQHGKEIRNTNMDFTEAFELYTAYSDTKSTLALEMKHEKKRLKELICHPQYGLCVYVIMDKFVVLRSDDIDMEEFVEAFILYLKSGETTRQEERIQLDSKLLSDILHSMDSEWDKNMVRVLIGSTRSR